MLSALWLVACGSVDVAPWAVPAQPARLPPPPGRCEGLREVGRLELGTTPVASTSGASATPTTVWWGGRELGLPGEVHALHAVGDELWSALGTAGLARVSASNVDVWPTDGEVVALVDDGARVWAADRHGRILGVDRAAAAGTPLEERAVDGFPRALALVDGAPAVPTAQPKRSEPDRIEALLPSEDGHLWVALAGASQSWVVEVDAALAEVRRVPIAGRPTGLAWGMDGLLVAATGLQRVRGDQAQVVALPGEELQDVAARGGRLAVASSTRGLVWLDADGRVAGEVAVPPDTRPSTAAWWGPVPVVGTRLYGVLLAPEDLRALPMPAERARGREGALWVAMPGAGIAHFAGDGALSTVALWPGARDLWVGDDGRWVAAVGTHGLRNAAGAACDLPGTTRRIERWGERWVAASDALIVVLEGW